MTTATTVSTFTSPQYIADTIDFFVLLSKIYIFCIIFKDGSSSTRSFWDLIENKALSGVLGQPDVATNDNRTALKTLVEWLEEAGKAFGLDLRKRFTEAEK